MGATTVICTAMDASGNVGTCTFDVVVQDTTPPVLTCPADIYVDATFPAGAKVIWPDLTATDVCDGSLRVSCRPSSASHFPLGTTEVRCLAQDGAGNLARCSFFVTVVETARQEKERALLLLRSLVPVGTKKADERITKAIERVEKSLKPDLWVDGYHLTKKGHEVFNREREAVRELQKIAPPPRGVALAIATLVNVDRRIVRRAIEEMMPIDSKRAMKAREEVLKAEAAFAAGDPDKAIEHFHHAWHQARKN